MLKKDFLKNFIQGFAYTCGVEIARLGFKELNRYREQQIRQENQKQINGKADGTYINKIGF